MMDSEKEIADDLEQIDKLIPDYPVESDDPISWDRRGYEPVIGSPGGYRKKRLPGDS